MRIQILAYLLAEPVPTEPIATVSHYNRSTRIISGQRNSEIGDEEHLQYFSKILLSRKKEATFETLHQSLPFTWFKDERYDTVNPFGDVRQMQYRALWTFDTQNDMLRFTNANRSSQMPLALLRERAVSLADMELLGGPIPLPLESTLDSGLSCWKPRIEVDDRMSAFTHRLLRDFHHQWRHILRNDFNTMTSKRLARGIMRIATLDFEVRHNTGGHGPYGVHVWITQLPPWKPFKTNVVRMGNILVVLCQTIQEGLSKAQQHHSSQNSGVTQPVSTTDSSKAQADYLILSVKHIVLCHAIGPDLLEHTSPEPLFNGDSDVRPPSELALNYLIWATASARRSAFTPLQTLPSLVQDIIIDYASAGCGTVVAARVGCLLGLGPPFTWKDGPFVVTLEERYKTRPSGMPVESQIWFDEHESGIFYLARWN